MELVIGISGMRSQQISYDLFQMVRGIGNIFKGIFNIIAFPFVLIGAPLYYLISRQSMKKESLGNIKNHFKDTNLGFGYPSFFETLSYPIAWALEGIVSLLRGISQLISQPLVWFIKMPLRGLITYFGSYPLLAEQNIHIEKLITLAKNIVHEGPEEYVKSIENKDPALKNAYIALWSVSKDGILTDVKGRIDYFKTVHPNVFDSKDKAYLVSKKAKLEWIEMEVRRKYDKAIKAGQKTEISQDRKERFFKDIFAPIEKTLENKFLSLEF